MEKIHLDSPLVSICMPAYNAGNYILQAITSVLSQSYQNIELIIVNDGSTDHTKILLTQITDKRVKVIHTENKGQCAAANLAYKNATGSLIKFMDADDLISENFILLQVEKLTGKTDEIVGASWKRFYHDITESQQIKKNEIDTSEPINWLIAAMDGKQVMLQCAQWLIPRNILELSGLWDETLSLINDFEFFIRVILHAHSISFAEDAVLYYRSGLKKSLSSTKSYTAAKSAYHSIEKGTGHLLKHENSRRVRKVAAECFQHFVYDFYPAFTDLTLNAENRIKELGGTKIPFQAGGITRLLINIFGWRFTKRIKNQLKKN